jgi:hypothetical protein
MAINGTLTLIQAITVGAGGAATIDFTSIPQTYTDLVVKYCARQSTGSVEMFMTLNNDSTNAYSYKMLRANQAVGVAPESATSQIYDKNYVNWSATTANTFGNGELYLPNYTDGNQKTWTFDTITENNSTDAWMQLHAGARANTAAINRITFTPSGGSFVQYSTMYLYGVVTASVGIQATGGVISQDANYFYHTFTSSGVFTPTTTVVADVLVAAGGGGGGYDRGGGGGAGGLIYAASQTLTGAKTVTVGAGGAGASTAIQGSNGSTTSFTGLTSGTGGGGGGSYSSSYTDGLNGGCGGGGGSWNNSNTFLGGTGSQGFNGGNGRIVSGAGYWPGGGGGMGGAGVSGTAGEAGATRSGGLGVTYFGANYCAGGGAGTEVTATNFGSSGGASAGNGFAAGRMNGLPNQGGGGGGGGTGGNGGSGVVVVRYAK